MTLTELQGQRRWVLWRLEKNKDGKDTKRPYQLCGRLAACNTSSTWATFAECQAIFDSGGFSGLGMVLGNGVVGVDIDGCVTDGQFSRESREIVIALNSYSELSPSGTGSHTWGLDTLRDRKGIKQPHPGCKAVEVKAEGFFHTFSGRHLSKTPADLMPMQAAVDALYTKLTQRTRLVIAAPKDEQERFDKLWAGDLSDYDGDASRGDLALCCILVRRCRNNFFEIDKQFRKSGLYRDKWEREDYASATILKAIQANRLSVEPAALDEDSPAEWTLEPLQGREEGWFPLGEVSLVGGPSGAGKTHVLIKIAECVRHGIASFGHRTCAREYGILLHDRSKASMRRTCRASKLPVEDVMSRVVRLTKDQQKGVPADIVEAAILNQPNVKLWILEGLDFWTPELHKLDKVGDVLDALQRVATAHRVAIVGTLGSPKQKEHDRYASGRDQFMGSVAFGRKSETCISISRTSDKNVRKMAVYTRNTGDEEFYTTWNETGLVLTTKPEDYDKDAELTTAAHKMEMNVFAACHPGDELRYAKHFGPAATFFRWRRIAEAAGKVVKTAKKWYRTAQPDNATPTTRP